MTNFLTGHRLSFSLHSTLIRGAIKGTSLLIFCGSLLWSQAAAPPPPPDPSAASEDSKTPPTSSGGQQTKRILGIAPNFTAVSANTSLPPLSPKQKFRLATQGTFDYSSFISVGLQAGIEQATSTYPEFRQGAAGYARYYWHTFADFGIENYMTGAIFSSVFRQDPRYYTLYHGSFLHRVTYAVSRLAITKTDSGKHAFNYAEVLGSGAAAGISSRYYPAPERGGNEIFSRWGSQLLNDSISNVFEEFWPDIHHKLFSHH